MDLENVFEISKEKVTDTVKNMAGLWNVTIRQRMINTFAQVDLSGMKNPIINI